MRGRYTKSRLRNWRMGRIRFRAQDSCPGAPGTNPVWQNVRRNEEQYGKSRYCDGQAADILEKLGIDYEMTIISAHREPDVFFEYAKSAEVKGFKVIIAGAGMAAHLPGMCAAIFPMPVIGIPMHTTSLGGRDSLYSIVKMPSGIPVATVAINGGANAGLLAAKILATSDDAILQKLKEYSKELKEQVQAKDARLQEVGYQNY